MMRQETRLDGSLARRWRLHLTFALILGLLAFLPAAQALGANVTVKLVGEDGVTPLAIDFRYTVEEDLTFHPEANPGFPNFADQNVLSFNFHRSYMPVVSTGTGAAGTATVGGLDPAKFYFISVLPSLPEKHTMGGGLVRPGQTSLTISLNNLPLPTAQISVFVFEDNNRINGVADLPQEHGLEGFIVNIREAGGRYGANGELITQDAFGNPLGTTYKPDGSVLAVGDGIIMTDANGLALIKNLPPAKYGVTISPPLGTNWVQTSTIEGSPTIDAWVKANEPSYFTEFGPAGHHCIFGFVRPFKDTAILSGGTTIQGQVVSDHMNRPPNYGFNAGALFPDTWVGLNDSTGKGVFAGPCDANSNFTISGVPAGTWQLVVWDKPLDVVIASTLITVWPDGTCGPVRGGSCNLNKVAVFDWFAHLMGKVFYDTNQNGFQDLATDPTEVGLSQRTVNIRWRDGTLYQSATTGPDGSYHFAEVFPFFNWLVAEVDFLNMKPTGLTAVVDAGGPVNTAVETFPGYGRLTPQVQPVTNPNTGDNLSRTETGPVLTQPFQAFLGQTNVIEWGKVDYPEGETGGIAGMVFYDTTRAEDDPYYGIGETWQPGIPNVTVNLYSVDAVTLAETYVTSTTTDSWDANRPTGCPGDPNDPFYMNAKCYDGMRNWNQVRPGVFDGGYGFSGLAPGIYVVEVVPPPGYKLVRSQDKNVDFGDTYKPAALSRLPECVGPTYVVPAELSLFPGEPAPLAGRTLNDCNRKKVYLSEAKNAAADFFLFTDAPIASHVVGMILNDLANEFDPNNPNFGEKFAPSWVPIGFYDYLGKEITRVYSDQYGNFNALLPGTYSVNIPSPSGVAPNMVVACMNDPGPIPDPANPGEFIVDPYYSSQYSQFCYTFQYMPGATTYLDTPVLPIAAFAGQRQFPLDCEFPNKTPVISYVTNPNLNGAGGRRGGGPYIPNKNANNGAQRRLQIRSMGPTLVPNPAYDGTAGSPKTIVRDFGFGGTRGTVTLGNRTLDIVRWNNRLIEVEVPRGTNTGQLMVTRGDNQVQTVYGITVTMGPLAQGNTAMWVNTKSSIQAALDLAKPGDLILVEPGTYNELVVMYEDVYLQGYGAPSVLINAVKRPGEKLQAWRDKVASIVTAPGTNYLLPGQVLNFDPANNEPGLLNTAEGPGILVLADRRKWTPSRKPRIDGFGITGSDIGGAIVVNGNARALEISNNKLFSNHGLYAGGIRVGHPDLFGADDNPIDANNWNMKVHHNFITQNGSTAQDGAGGIGLFSGSAGYEVTENYVCGNFAVGSGGGIGHLGLSAHPQRANRIADNKVLFNQCFNQVPASVSEGGGISIAGVVPPPNAAGGLTAGTGSVLIDSNRIHGNLAGSGDGGGIRLAYVNGQDVLNNPGKQDNWYTVQVFNNMISNNVSGLAGGGIILKDTLKAGIIHNTIVHNDTTATAGEAFPRGVLFPSSRHPAGVVSRAHSPELLALNRKGFSDPELKNNILWRNRAFFWDPSVTNAQGIAVGGLLNGSAWDLGVLGRTATLNPRNCLLTSLQGIPAGNNNVTGNPRFVSTFPNGASGLPVQPENTVPLTAAAVDEGGNFIDVRFGPLSLINPGTGVPYVDLRINANNSPALGAGIGNVVNTYPPLRFDYFNNNRPSNRPDIGAHERN